MKLLRLLDPVIRPQIVYAHCDVPCGIYETDSALVAAETIGRMVEIIEALPPVSKRTLKEQNTFVRCVLTKEEHARICKQQLLILWSDFFKVEHLEKFPNLHDKFWMAAKLCSKNKQEVDMKAAEDLKKAILEISEMFSQAKA